MAEPREKAAPQTSTVASCAATDCAHNEERSCHAGSVSIRMEEGRAVCGTYRSEAPKARP